MTKTDSEECKMRPFVAAQELHIVSRDDALVCADRFLRDCLGAARSPLIQYRSDRQFQTDWKEEVGHWLMAAKRGFRNPEDLECGQRIYDHLCNRAQRAKRKVQPTPPDASTTINQNESRKTEIDPNESEHKILQQELAPAMVSYYFSGVGWSFRDWEPITGGGEDVDVALTAPGDVEVHVQVKASNEPGRVVNHQLLVSKNKYDQDLICAVEKAARQLPKNRNAVNLVVVCAQRTLPLSSDPECLVVHLFGATTQMPQGFKLKKSNFGRFFKCVDPWRHISGVVMLDFVRGLEKAWYSCTVLLNPNADQPARPDWFSRAKVCSLDGNLFRWIPCEPGDERGETTLPDGTEIDHNS